MPETMKWIELLVPWAVALVSGWALMKKQGDRNEKANDTLASEFRVFVETLRREQALAAEERRAEIEALSGRIDAKFEKITATLSSVQSVSEESMRQVRAAWGRIEEESRRSSDAREFSARLEEQLRSQKELLADLKRTQELRLDEVRRAIAVGA